MATGKLACGDAGRIPASLPRERPRAGRLGRPRRLARTNPELTAPVLPAACRCVGVSSIPSIKGSALSSVVEDVRALRDSGRISADRLEASLEAADVALLETKIQPALWYPIASYARLTRAPARVAGRGDPQYVVDRGARAAQRLWESGLYVQLQHGEEKARRRAAAAAR